MQPVQFSCPVHNQAFSIGNKLPQLALILTGDVACLQQPMLSQICNPLRIRHIRFTSGNRFHVLRVYHHGGDVTRFKDIVQRLPVRTRTFHCYHLAVIGFQPVCQLQKFPCSGSRLPYILLSAIFQAGYKDLLVNINTTTNVVNFLHDAPREKDYGTVLCLNLILLYVVLLLALLDRWWCVREP